jgi:hypothetical protein
MWDRIGASPPEHMTVGESTLWAVHPDACNPFESSPGDHLVDHDVPFGIRRET